MNNEIVSSILLPQIGVAWLPLLLVVLFSLVAAWFHLWGRKNFRSDYNKNSDQVKPYNSGNLDEVDYSIDSSNLYWGFRKSLNRYFEVIKDLHDGDLNNYAKWFVISMAVCLLIIGGGLL